MSTIVGILVWVPNTVPFKNLIKRGAGIAGCDAKKYDQQENAARAVYSKGNTTMKSGRKDVLKVLQSAQSKFSSNYMHLAISRMGSSPEAQIMLRTNFGRSMAAVSIASYILGIGDRHLENLLLDETSGAVVPIDFGHAFGSAIYMLNFPELMPFRLTKQMSECFGPLGVQKLVRDVMVHVMRVLRGSQAQLLTLLDVFVKEPTVEWSRRKLKAQSQAEAVEGSTQAEQFAQDKIAIAKHKLNGLHPSEVMCRELAHWGNKKDANNRMILEQAVRGEGGHTRRGRHSRNAMLTVGDQVECLIDQATDPNIIGRAFPGWSPFL